MDVRKLHDDEPDIDEALVRALLEDQFPQWAALPLRYVDADGTQNVLFRLGDEYALRMPRVPGELSEDERRWMPVLAGQLPFPVPVMVAQGKPGRGFPHPWRIHRWLTGEPPEVGSLTDPQALAEDLAAFVTALRGIDTTGAPRSYRDERLPDRDADTRRFIAELAGRIDADAALAVWDTALGASRGTLPEVWLHGDLQPGNLLVADGRLSAVIDFDCMGLGEPAVDLICAWYVLQEPERKTFQAAVGQDENTWARARGWALSIAAAELAYYEGKNPFMARTAERVIGEVLAECRD
ncbi:aminoglycoside phosphotransferase family protein [Streptomyces sp. NPDC050095]|uniref:aminoglycoside phosphotransferase family protein n=1 Tax=unclassified Streptomyces TaxID=2593676 RepID=UPI003445C02C